MKYLRFDEYCVQSKGLYVRNGVFTGYGYLCTSRNTKESDKYVSIYFVKGVGYQYQIR
jgi:hypothetical protein